MKQLDTVEGQRVEWSLPIPFTVNQIDNLHKVRYVGSEPDIEFRSFSKRILRPAEEECRMDGVFQISRIRRHIIQHLSHNITASKKRGVNQSRVIKG